MALVDDDELALGALRELVATGSDELAVVAACPSVDRLIECCQKPPDVVILDVMLADRAAGLEANVARLRAWGARVLAISSQPDRREVTEAIRLMELNFLPKDGIRDLLHSAVRDTAQGNRVISPRMAPALVWGDQNSTDPGLTPRERQIAKHLASGLRPKRVARVLGIREDTVRDHERRIKEKYRAVGRPVDDLLPLHYAALQDEIITDPHEILREVRPREEQSEDG
ncbi:response regulator [Streptomyces sp. NPDC093094]|uniref:response regulator n=1 Tax=Streptomyces sp. NPDC093094 TaxID=3366026 RepID=UPI00382E2B1F